MPTQARVVLGCGIVGLLVVVINALALAPELPTALPAFQRASVLAGVMAVGLMLVAVLWSRANPRAPERVVLDGEQGLRLNSELTEAVRLELAWASHQLLTATPAASVVLIWDGECVLRRGVLSNGEFVEGPILNRARAQQQSIGLVNLALYPGRTEFSCLPSNIPALIVEPMGQRGWLLVGGWSIRCFSRSDELWIKGIAAKLRTQLEGQMDVPVV